MTLEYNECRVITAENGQEALHILSQLDDVPDLIVSDILMPKMDGYSFFNNVSVDEKYAHIPFIFLTALDSPEDVRLGKLLGVDDYLTKPINEDILIATIAGKITRNKKIKLLSEKINKFFSSYDTDLLYSISEEEKKKVVLLEVVWDDKIGPKLSKYYPDDIDYPFSINKIGEQLYDSANSIYGQNGIKSAEGILVNLENFKVTGYGFFDSYPDESFRGGMRDFMFGVLAPKISYFHSLQIKEILKEITGIYKQQKMWHPKDYWEKISMILSKSPL